MTSEAERKAGEILEHVQWDRTLPVPAMRIAKCYGIECIPCEEMRGGCVDARECGDGNGGFAIVFNPACDEARLNFSIARELGRLFVPIHGTNSEGEWREDEKDLNMFAGALLMPEEILREKAMSCSAKELSEIFLCLENAVEARTRRVMDPFEAIEKFHFGGSSPETLWLRSERRHARERHRKRICKRKNVAVGDDNLQIEGFMARLGGKL